MIKRKQYSSDFSSLLHDQIYHQIDLNIFWGIDESLCALLSAEPYWLVNSEIEGSND